MNTNQEITQEQPPSMDMTDTAENHKFYNMFDDSKLKNAFAGMSKNDQEQYKKQGEHMYSKDYVNVNLNQEDKILESVAYISEGLKSGLSPSLLEENEREIMRNVYGKLWYERFGYSSETE